MPDAPDLAVEGVLFFDIETRSPINLKKSGAWRYAEDPDTDVFMVCWTIGDGPIETWYPTKPVPEAVRKHIEAGGWVSAHNVGFELPVTNRLLAPRYGWPTLEIAQLHDTAAEAAAMGLPRSLEEVARALGLPIVKDTEGHAHMMRMCRPRAKVEREDGTVSFTWFEDKERVERLARYCATDVRVAREVFRRLRRLPPEERIVWELDQRINQRGIKVDLVLAKALEDIVTAARADLDREMARLTGGAVPRCTMTTTLSDWLCSLGLEVESVAKPAVTALLARRDLPPEARAALELRRDAARASAAKLKVMREAACSDGRLRGMFRYHGASTGRWAGALVQLHNLPRKSPPGSIETAAETAREFGYDGVTFQYGDPMGFSSSMLRPCLVPGEGEEMYSADLSQIEARMVAALAGEQAVLNVFAGGHDIYCHAASGIFNRPVTKADDQQRQVGKVSTLALGFGGGPVAFSAMAKNYNLDIAAAYGSVRAAAEPDHVERAYWGWERYEGDMSERAYVTADLIKQAWRLANPAIVRFWQACEEAALHAVDSPRIRRVGRPFAAGGCIFQVKEVGDRDYLWVRLPNRRLLCYADPEIRTTATAWGALKRSVYAWTVDNRTRKRVQRSLYGGLLVENLTQAAARDVLVEGMLRLDAAGFAIVGHVHDEVILTAPRGSGATDRIRDLMTRSSAWMEKLGLPVDADVSPPLSRYKK